MVSNIVDVLQNYYYKECSPHLISVATLAYLAKQNHALYLAYSLPQLEKVQENKCVKASDGHFEHNDWLSVVLIIASSDYYWCFFDDKSSYKLMFQSAFSWTLSFDVVA